MTTEIMIREFYQDKYLGLEELLSRYRRSERPLIQKFMLLARKLEESNIPYLWIGSGPIPLLTKKEYRSKLRESSDIDIVIPTSSNPGEIMPLVEDVFGSEYENLSLSTQRLVERVRYSTIKGNRVEYGPGIVHHYVSSSNRSVPLCVFKGEISIVPVYDSDFNNPIIIQVNNQILPIPPLGLFLASRIHPYAITESRAYKTGLIVESMPDEKIDLVARNSNERFKKVLDIHPDVITLEHFKRAKNRLENLARKKSIKKFSKYIEKAFDL